MKNIYLLSYLSFTLLGFSGCLTKDLDALCDLDPNDPRCICEEECAGETPVCDVESKTCVAAPPTDTSCTTDEQCEGDTPRCESGVCVACKTETAAMDCLAATPLCEDNRCVECTEASHCDGNAGGPVCSPQNTCVPRCTEDTDCDDTSLKCNDAGACVPKTCEDFVDVCGAGDFAALPHCEDNRCVECTEASHCEGNANGPVCSPQNTCAAECSEDANCGDENLKCNDAGACVPKTCDDTRCGAFDVCDPDTLGCVACLNDEHCQANRGAGFRCIANNTCVPECTEDAECDGRGLVCDESEGACTTCDIGDDPEIDRTCAAPLVCSDIEGTPRCVECTDDTHCEGNDQRPVCDTFANKCIGCNTDRDCNDPQVCDPETQTCTFCSANLDDGDDANDHSLCSSPTSSQCDRATQSCVPCNIGVPTTDEGHPHCIGNIEGDFCSFQQTCIPCRVGQIPSDCQDPTPDCASINGQTKCVKFCNANPNVCNDPAFETPHQCRLSGGQNICTPTP